MSTNLVGLFCVGAVIFIFFGVGVAAIILGIRNRKKAEASVNWPSAPGRITNAWIDQEDDIDEDGFSTTTFTPNWQYQFTASGQTYTSDKISFGGKRGYGRQKKAQEALAAYPLHSQVRIYFDPANPSESVLVPGTKGTFLGIIVGAIFIVISIFGCIAGTIGQLINM